MRDIKTFLIITIICLCVLYLFKNDTYTSYESQVSADTKVNVGIWNISVNNQSVVYTNSLYLNDVTWNSNHTNPKKVAPGSTGTTKLNITNNAAVALRYDLSYDDSTNSENILTVTSVSNSIKTGENTYSGIVNLDQNGVVDVSLNWINDDTRSDEDSLIGNGGQASFVDFSIVFSQYNGEEIVEYR